MATEILNELQDTTGDLFQLLASFNQDQVNTIPFESSWTPGQIGEHITRSNKGIAQALSMEGKTTQRNSAERAQELKSIFLDFTVKFQSPEFILPTQISYQKEELLEELKKSTAHLQQLAGAVNLSEEIGLHPFGQITKLELLHFVVYHTRRHIHQVKNILLIKEKDVA